MKKIVRNKTLLLLLSIFILVGFIGCGTGEDNKKETTTQKDTDAVSSASVVDDKDSFTKAAGKNGTWIIILTDDLEFIEDIVVEGNFTHNNEPARKIAMYDQDENRNKTKSYKLQAPTLTVRSENTRLQGGTFVGDVYVEAKGFALVDGKIDGNLYFMNEEIQESFRLDEGASVTGETKVKKKDE